MTYEAYKNRSASKKVVLATLDSALRVANYVNTSGTTWEIETPFFIVSLLVDGVDTVFTRSSGKITFTSATAPSQVYLGVRHFYSNFPQVLPWNLDAGQSVEWEARIRGEVGDLKLDLDYQNTGIAIESNSNISLENTDGFFDEIFDTHIWEGGQAFFYSWEESLAVTDALPFYRGIISDKSFSTESVRFGLRDQLSQLRRPVASGLFTASDFTDLPNRTLLGKPKRTIYGQFDKLKCESVDVVAEGFLATGTFSGNANKNLLSGAVSGTSGGSTINGSGTLFITEGLFAGSKIRIRSGLNEFNFTVATVPTETQLTITGTLPQSFSNAEIRNTDVENNEILATGAALIDELRQGDGIKVVVDSIEYSYTVSSLSVDTIIINDEIERSFIASQIRIVPDRPSRFKNRLWHIAGHPLYTRQYEVILVVNPTNVELDSVENLGVGSVLGFGGAAYVVQGISGLVVRLNIAVPSSVVIGSTFDLISVPAAYIGQRRLFFGRDYTYDTSANLILDDLAEFNVTRSTPVSNVLQFVNGVPQVVRNSADDDLTTLIKPGDWIKPNTPLTTKWFEVFQVFDNVADITEDYDGPTLNTSFLIRSPDYVGDNSLVTVDCLGKGATSWLKTPSQAVQDILEGAGILNIDQPSFDQAVADCQYKLSYSIPAKLGDNIRDVRSCVTDINGSVFGSLTLGLDFNLRYSILNSDKPEGLRILGDDDVISFSVSTRNEIKSEVILQYRPATDIISGQSVTSEVILRSDFTEKVTKIEDILRVTAFLFSEQDAETIAQRWLFFRSQSNSLVTLRTKLQLVDASLNEVVGLGLRRLFRRFGGGDRLKLGLINSISRDGINTSVQVNDLGNVLNRVGVIAPDAQVEYLSAEREDVAKWAFIVDNQTETPGNLGELGNNLIG